jgi:hypothetical protein
MSWVLLTVALALVVALPWAGPRLRAWWRWRRHCLQLARRHGLDAAAAALVWRLGRRLAPECPLLVFVRPSLLARAVDELGIEPAAVAALQQQLFSA